MMMQATITADEIASLLDWRPETFRRRQARLSRQFGFPARLPGCRVWSRHAVMAWIDNQPEIAAAAHAASCPPAHEDAA
jgi:hypothetical protein